MKDSKNDSAPVLARFGRDKRTRTVKASAERVERRPHFQRDASDAEQPNHEPKRSSFNPNFTRDNRPAFDEKPRRSYGGHGGYGSYGDRKSRYADDRPDGGEHRGYHKEHPAYGDRPSYNDRPAFRSYNRKPQYGEYPRTDRPEADFNTDRPERTERPRRPYGDKPAYGSRNSRYGSGERKYGSAPRFSEDRPAERRYDSRGPKKGGFKSDRPNGGYRKNDDRPKSYPKYNPEQPSGAIRLNRFIAQSGLCSRREADDFIVAGVVTVNGKVVTELGTKVLPTDEVRFNDSRVEGEKKVYLVLNKPKGYVTSLDDPHATKTVMDLVQGACEERIYPVGRLDKNSVGLLLFTNDGDLTKQLTHPAYQKKKIYQVALDKPLTRADMDRIVEGIPLEDGEIHADEVAYVKENKQEIGIEIHSGRNRIVRRIFEFLGYEVKKLDRVYYAGLTKKKLKRGAWRFLTDEEVQRLKSGQYE